MPIITQFRICFFSKKTQSWSNGHSYAWTRTRDLLSFILTAQLIILAGAVIDIIFVTSKREEREMPEQQKIFNETVVNFMGGFQEMEWQKVSQLREPPNTEEGREAVVIFEPRSIRPS